MAYKQKGFDFGSTKEKNQRNWKAKPEIDYSPHNIAARKTEGTIKQQEARRNKVDPDAPGTPGTPGYEPAVKRSDLDAKGKALWDKKHGKNKKPGAPNYKNPQDYKVFNMGNKPTPVTKKKY